RLEIVFRRRRSSRPFQSGRFPWVRAGNFSVTPPPKQIGERQQVTQREGGCARGGKNIQDLKFRSVNVISPRHAEIPEDELRKEGEVEAGKSCDRAKLCETFRIKAAAD